MAFLFKSCVYLLYLWINVSWSFKGRFKVELESFDMDLVGGINVIIKSDAGKFVKISNSLSSLSSLSSSESEEDWDGATVSFWTLNIWLSWIGDSYMFSLISNSSPFDLSSFFDSLLCSDVDSSSDLSSPSPDSSSYHFSDSFSSDYIDRGG